MLLAFVYAINTIVIDTCYWMYATKHATVLIIAKTMYFLHMHSSAFRLSTTNDHVEFSFKF